MGPVIRNVIRDVIRPVMGDEVLTRFTGILDEVPGAAFAGSTRVLSRAFLNEPIVRVRRSSDSTEQDFTEAGITGGALLAFTGAGDGFVTTLYDQSGNDRDAVQTTVADQPLIVDGGVLVTENSKSAIDWTAGKFLDISTIGYTGSLSAFSVLTYAAANERLLDNRGTGTTGTVQGWHIKTTNPGADVLVFDEGNGTFIDLLDVTGTRTGQELYSCLTNGTTLDAYRKGVVVEGEKRSDGTLPVDFSNANGVRIGSNLNGNDTQRFTGKLQEVILYNLHQTANRSTIEANQAAHYGITLA